MDYIPRREVGAQYHHFDGHLDNDDGTDDDDDNDNDDEFEEQEEAATTNANEPKEPSPADVKSTEAVIRHPIECPKLPDDASQITIDNVRVAFDEPSKFNGYIEFVLRIVRLLPQHSPKKAVAKNRHLTIPRHIFVIEPFIYLANTGGWIRKVLS
ncbi:hypothetical protein BGZ83_010227 [Gryganskiella cystojenkinii]|nr:hypothetical protein BGZ83_010227 [Gryganskiella cystojenkinii]